MSEPDMNELKTATLTRQQWLWLVGAVGLTVLDHPDLEYRAGLEKAVDELTTQVTKEPLGVN